MPVIISKQFRFEAAHHLPAFPEGHKCRRLHGHSFVVEVKCEGTIDPNTGVLIDFGEIKAVVKPMIDGLDHQCLNDLAEKLDIPLLKNPTSENIAKWLYREIKPKLTSLRSVMVFETCTTSCEYYE